MYQQLTIHTVDRDALCEHTIYFLESAKNLVHIFHVMLMQCFSKHDHFKPFISYPVKGCPAVAKSRDQCPIDFRFPLSACKLKLPATNLNITIVSVQHHHIIRHNGIRMENSRYYVSVPFYSGGVGC